MLGPQRTMLRRKLPVIAVTAVRTGCGKSAVARWLSRRLRERGKRVAVLRHPMPYGDLFANVCSASRHSRISDAARCTIEEREEYEPHIAAGHVVFAGVDYADILARRRRGGRPHRLGRRQQRFLLSLSPTCTSQSSMRCGRATSRHIIPAKRSPAWPMCLCSTRSTPHPSEDARIAIEALNIINPTAPIVRAASPVQLDYPALVKGRRVLVIEDGPTITHGGMTYGAGYVAAKSAGAIEIVDPRTSAASEIRDVFAAYPHIGLVLPAVGYGETQLRALETSINASDAEVVVSATPIDLARLLRIEKPVIRARYEFKEVGEPTLSAILSRFLDPAAATRQRTKATS